MNTTTVSPSSALAAITTPVLEASALEVSTLRTQLEAAEQRLKADQDTVAAAAREEMRARIASVPSLLGVTTIKEAIALMVPHSPSAFPARLPDTTLAQMRAMLEAGATSRAVAEALKVGLSTVDSRKAQWGLTNRGLGGGHRQPQARKTKAVQPGSHLSEAKRARIVIALKRPHARVALIARREATSRQTVYTIRSTIPELIAA